MKVKSSWLEGSSFNFPFTEIRHISKSSWQSWRIWSLRYCQVMLCASVTWSPWRHCKTRIRLVSPVRRWDTFELSWKKKRHLPPLTLSICPRLFYICVHTIYKYIHTTWSFKTISTVSTHSTTHRITGSVAQTKTLPLFTDSFGSPYLLRLCFQRLQVVGDIFQLFLKVTRFARWR